jgi:hypothetical protein
MLMMRKVKRQEYKVHCGKSKEWNLKLSIPNCGDYLLIYKYGKRLVDGK